MSGGACTRVGTAGGFIGLAGRAHGLAVISQGQLDQDLLGVLQAK
ncbi:MAG: hypothetical protein V7756_01560 [Halopseudomonas sp.]